MADKTLYTKNSIESLDPLAFTRLKPGVYCGNTAYATQLLVEIVSNSIDEFRLAHGSVIDVEVKGNVVRVRDQGQGFLVNSVRDDGKTILEAAFSVLNTSGKYRSDGTYEGTSLGSFGIGSKLATFLSHWLKVQTWRDGKTEIVWFKEGVFEKREVKSSTEPSGTEVTWEASEEFFGNAAVEIKEIKNLFNTISCLCPGLTIKLNDNGKTYEYFSKNGINDLVNEFVKDKEIITNRFNMNFIDGKNKMDMVMTYTSNYAPSIVAYVNTGLTESGPHISQIKTVVTREMNKFFREKKWLKEKDENLTGDDVQEGMYIVFNITAPNVAYDAQVKSRITQLDMKPFTSAFADGLAAWMNANEKIIKPIAEKALLARKAREAAKKAKEAVREPKSKKSKLLNLPTKLVDAWSKDRKSCEIFIAEGDSAASGLVGARNGEFQAVFPIRGKILNTLKASDTQIFANQEIVNLIKALGLDLDPKTKKMIYDVNKLRYGKIMLAADGDADGQAIKNLVLTCIWTLCPELIINGHVYATVPPLFRITTKKNEYIYLRDQAALEEYKTAHAGESYLVNRNKGLGEQDAQELGECIVDSRTRNVAQITVADSRKAAELFEIFQGPAVTPRREYILKYSEDATL